MNLLTQRALRVFAVLEDYRGGTGDILDAVLPFFEPVLAEFDGKILDPSALADRVRSAYKWNVTGDIVEELVPRFEARGWVKVTARTSDKIVCQVTCSNPVALPLGPNEVKVTERLSKVVDQFQQFILGISPLTQFARTKEELSDILVEWLVSIDAYTEDVLKARAETVQTEKRISLIVNLPDASRLSNDERYLCARFVQMLSKDNSPFIQDLCKIASVGLLTEVIQDFQKPLTRVDKTDLIVYLDAPVALDLVGVSGAANAANIRPIVAKLQEIGASVRIFRASLEELTRALDAVLRRSPPERTGPTADAIRRRETTDAFARQVANDPMSILSTYGVAVVDRKLNQFPREHEYFPANLYEDLFSKMKWHLDMHRREHDATVIAQVMRMRVGVQSRDLFQSQQILLTKNAPLAQLGRRFCIENDLLQKSAVGPAIHQRQLATAIWLRTGLGGSEEIPKRYVLAACERVLELKKNVVEQVRLVARGLTPQQAEQLDLLLTQDRSAQVLMDKTLGASQIITAATIEPLIDSMRRELVADIEAEKLSEVEGIEREAKAKVREAQRMRRAAEARARELTDSLGDAADEDLKVIQRLVAEINARILKRQAYANWSIGAAVFAIGLLPLLIESLAGGWKIFALIVSGVVGAVLGAYQLLDRPIGIGERVQRWGLVELDRIAAQRGIDRKLSRVGIAFKNGQLELLDDFEPAEDLLD